MNTILLMADFEDYVFWVPHSKEEGYLPTEEAIDIETLSLSEEVVKRLKEWSNIYSNYLGLFPSKEIEFNFNQMGLILYTLVSRELKDKYHVVYYDEVLNKVIDEEYVNSL